MPQPPERMHRHSGPIKRSGEMRPATQAEQQAYLRELEEKRAKKIEQYGGEEAPRGLSFPDKNAVGSEHCLVCNKEKPKSTMYHIGDKGVCRKCMKNYEM